MSRLQEHTRIVPLVVTTIPATIAILSKLDGPQNNALTMNETMNSVKDFVIVDDIFDDELS